MRARLLLVLVPVLGGTALAGGLVLPEPGPAALGRAGAAAAIPDGPSAVYENPAGLAIGRGLTLQAGVSIVNDRQALSAGGVTSRGAATTATPDIFVAQRLGDHFAIGAGVRRAVAQSLEYPDAFPGRFTVQRASFGGTALTFAAAGRPFSFLAIGFGLDVVFGDLDLAQASGDARYETRRTFAGHAIGLGGVAALWARLYRDYLTLGVVYRSALDLDESGRLTTTLPGSATPLAVEDGRLTLPMPHLLTFALGSRPRPSTSVQLEARLGLLRDLDGFTLKDTAEPAATLLAVPLPLRELVQLRLGAEQRLLGDRLALRLGVGYDLGAGRRDVSAALPDGDRVVVAAGLGYGRSDFSLDVGYLGAFSPGRTGSHGVAYPASYTGARHTVGLSLSVRIAGFGTQPKRFD